MGSGVDKQDVKISGPPFLPCTPCATVAGFDRIARTHASATRKWAFKSGEAEASALCVSILLLPLFLHRIRLLPSRRRRSAAIEKEKTMALERTKKATGAAKGKKTNRGSSSRSGLPLGWIQGDWI